jgi:hypothetical protein
MGRKNGPYKADFPAGTRVRILEIGNLIRFREHWKLHHPVSEEMLLFAGKTAIVKSVGFYHGGDELYELYEIPGTWHEECLMIAEQTLSADL